MLESGCIMGGGRLIKVGLYIRSNVIYNSKGNQHCPNQYFTIFVQQIKSSQMLLFDKNGKPQNPEKNYCVRIKHTNDLTLRLQKLL